MSTIKGSYSPLSEPTSEREQSNSPKRGSMMWEEYWSHINEFKPHLSFLAAKYLTFSFIKLGVVIPLKDLEVIPPKKEFYED